MSMGSWMGEVVDLIQLLLGNRQNVNPVSTTGQYVGALYSEEIQTLVYGDTPNKE
jgi:hypothetical protein